MKGGTYCKLCVTILRNFSIISVEGGVIMPISVMLVARYFLSKVVPGTKREITHLKLQKLIYYAQGYFLAITNGQIIFDDRIEAWVHGPVCPTIYYEYKKHGIRPIPKGDSVIVPDEYQNVLEAVWEAYGEFSGSELERMTHQEDPWIQARSGIPNWQAGSNQISIQSMRDYFLKELNGAC